jgi:hypothetical protein
MAEWQTQGTFRQRRIRLWRKNPLPRQELDHGHTGTYG